MHTVKKCMAAWELEPRPVRGAAADILDEIREFVEAPSWDEFTDCLWAIGRFISDAGLGGGFPVTEYTFRKYSERYARWVHAHAPGCECNIRSRCKCGCT